MAMRLSDFIKQRVEATFAAAEPGLNASLTVDVVRTHKAAAHSR